MSSFVHVSLTVSWLVKLQNPKVQTIYALIDGDQTCYPESMNVPYWHFLCVSGIALPKIQL